MISFRAAAPCVLLVLAAQASPPSCGAQEIAAVIGSSKGPFQAAYDAFVGTLGREVPTARLPGGRLPGDGARVIVAFGGEAALQAYPDSAVVIACLSPGLGQGPRRSGRLSHVTMRPAPARLLSEMRRLQPGLARLAVLSHGVETREYLSELRRAAEPLGIQVIAPDLNEPGGIPVALRSLLAAKPQAVWLAPDPLLVTPENFQAVLQFSWNNDVPFYAPTKGLAAAGAAASVSVSPEEQGRLAAGLARRALSGERLPRLIHPDNTRTAVNPASAKKAGLDLDPTKLAGVEVVP